MLSEREVEVLKMRKTGKTQVEVAKELDITQAAVSNFERNAKRKIVDAKQTLSKAKQLGVSQE